MQHRVKNAFRYLCIALLFALASGDAIAQFKSEDLLIDQLVMNLRGKDAISYGGQFASFDSVWRILNRITPATPSEGVRLANMRNHPEKLRQFDPTYNKSIEIDFKRLVQKGIDSGVHWSEIVMMRYELEKMILTKDMIGFEKIAPIRLQGYVFLQDVLTTRLYMLAVKNIFSFDNKMYGGQVVNILEAQNVDEYYEKLAIERKMEKQMLLAEMYPDSDTTITDSTAAQATAKKDAQSEEDEDEEDNKKKLKKVQDRKLYIGTLDDEMRIELYLRSLQGACPDPICGWEAIYKFGDNEEYLKLNVVKKPDGKWIMTEDSEEGILELTLNGSSFTGIWLSPQDKVEYEVKMEERQEVKAKKLYMLDDIIEGF